MLTMPRTKIAPAVGAPKSFLATMDIFKSVPVAALREIEWRMVEKKYFRQEPILMEGDSAESVWFVKEGHVKAVVHIASGRCQTLCMVGAKHMFGSCCALGGGEYPCHVVAETDVTVLSLPMNDFTALMGKYPQVGTALVAQISSRLRLSKDMQTFDQENVEKRILHVLIGLVREFGNTIPLTRKEVAEMVGTTVETSIRTFSKLEAQGLVATGRGRIMVRNVKELEQRLEAA
jgi:CRP/FNR family transcriptional regulator